MALFKVKISFHVSSSEFEQIKNAAENEGLTISEFSRAAALRASAIYKQSK